MSIILFVLMTRRPPGSTQIRSSAASDVYKRQVPEPSLDRNVARPAGALRWPVPSASDDRGPQWTLSLIHISEPPRPY